MSEGAPMSEEFRAAVEEVIMRHAAELDADDLRTLAGDIESIADKWEATSL
jgi:hypothetical protein